MNRLRVFSSLWSQRRPTASEPGSLNRPVQTERSGPSSVIKDHLSAVQGTVQLEIPESSGRPNQKQAPIQVDTKRYSMSDGSFDQLSLADVRAAFGLTQAEMARQMGMPLRSYQDIESKRQPLRPVHRQAAKYALLLHCADRKIPFERLPFEIQVAVEKAIAPSRSSPEFREWLRQRPMT